MMERCEIILMHDSYESVKNLAKFRGSLVGVKNAEAFYVERMIK